MSLVFLDTETTGLDPAKDQIWEIAYAVNDGPILSEVVTHNPLLVSAEVAALNGYHDRVRHYRGGFAESTFLGKLRESLDGATLVGANPAFDAGFLRARWGETPWHYRMLDVESYAMGALGWDRPKGLKDIAAELPGLGHAIPEPDHTAAGDVATLRAAYIALRVIYNGLHDSSA